VIEYDHGDQIPAVLLRSSHCGGKSLKGHGTRASNRFLRRSRYQGDIIKTSTPVSPPVFPELRAPLHWSADRFDATPGTAAIGHSGMGKVMVKHKSH
jgi:hypothetical protein